MFLEGGAVQCEYIVAGKISSPSCQDLGIPGNEKQSENFYQVRATSASNNNNEDDRMRHKVSSVPIKMSPFSPYCMIPLPAPFGSSLFDPTCIRRRNERERERVRNVNEGYLRLKEHLPIKNKDKRISKVETLRGAIRYIKYLQTILDDVNDMKPNDGTVTYGFSTEQFSRITDSEISVETRDRHIFSKSLEHSDSETDTSYFSSDSADTLSDGECK